MTSRSSVEHFMPLVLLRSEPPERPVPSSRCLSESKQCNLTFQAKKSLRNPKKSPFKRPLSKEPAPEDNMIQWAVYEMDQDQWTDLEPTVQPQPKKRRVSHIPPRYRKDKKLRIQPKVVVKDVMLWMVCNLKKEYGM